MLAVFAGEALLLAFALKLRVSGAAAGGLSGRPRVPSGALGLGLEASVVDRAAGFLGQCMPVYALQPGSGRAVLQVGGSHAAWRAVRSLVRAGGACGGALRPLSGSAWWGISWHGMLAGGQRRGLQGSGGAGASNPELASEPGGPTGDAMLPRPGAPGTRCLRRGLAAWRCSG